MVEKLRIVFRVVKISERNLSSVDKNVEGPSFTVKRTILEKIVCFGERPDWKITEL